MIPLVLCGGSGTRLWPVSRASFPKQFCDLFEGSLLEKTLRRVAPLGEPRVVASEATAVLVRRTLAELEELGVTTGRPLFEPQGKNTAPAVALACRVLQLEGNGSAVAGIFPADHLVEDRARFEALLRLAARVAHDGAASGTVVTLGMAPRRPATGYGYIEVDTEAVVARGEGEDPPVAYVARGFREKPDPETARRYVESGRFAWNAGVFVFRVDAMALHFERLMPELWASLEPLEADLSNLATVWRTIEGPSVESLDYGIMEHLESHASIPGEVGWSDVGSWDEVARLGESSPRAWTVPVPAETAAPDRDDDTSDEGDSDDGDGDDGHGNFVVGHGDRIYGLVGVRDLLVVDSADALLVARRGASQAVKELVATLREEGRAEADEHVFEHRPWGSFEVLRDTERFKSKILRVSPGKRLSYQSHRHRSEHWVVVRGRPRVVLDGETIDLAEGQHVFIPQGAKHRIANPTEDEVEIVEIQLGTYFGEDDIVRYEDDFDRA